MHFAAPNIYGILDRHVCYYVYKKELEDTEEEVAIQDCLEYWEAMGYILQSNQAEVQRIHKEVKSWLGYDNLYEMRALELVIYVSAKLASLGVKS